MRVSVNGYRNNDEFVLFFIHLMTTLIIVRITP